MGAKTLGKRKKFDLAFHRQLEQNFPYWDGGVDYQKNQEELLKSVMRRNKKKKKTQNTRKSREEFCKGFAKGASFSLAAYSLYSLTTSAAHAADSNVPQAAPKTPGDTGAVVGGASAICGAALQSVDFYLGLACAFLLVVGGIVINRQRPSTGLP